MLVLSSAFGAPPRTALVPESSLSASTTCVSIVSNVKDAWCERNCNNVDAPNCPEAVCNCGRNVVSASTVTKKGWTKQDFTNITSGASDSDSSFVGAQIPDEALGFCTPSKFTSPPGLCDISRARIHTFSAFHHHRYEGVVVHERRQ